MFSLLQIFTFYILRLNFKLIQSTKSFVAKLFRACIIQNKMSNPISIYFTSCLIWYCCKYEVNFGILIRVTPTPYNPWGGKPRTPLTLGKLGVGGVLNTFLGALSEILSMADRRSLPFNYIDRNKAMHFFETKNKNRLTFTFSDLFLNQTILRIISQQVSA